MHRFTPSGIAGAVRTAAGQGPSCGATKTPPKTNGCGARLSARRTEDQPSRCEWMRQPRAA